MSVKQSWYTVGKDNSVKSFKKCTISNVLDGSEDCRIYEEEKEKKKKESSDDIQGFQMSVHKKERERHLPGYCQ